MSIGQGKDGAWTRTSRVIKASPEALFHAFVDAAALLEWLPPGDMTGVIHAFDARIGGGYVMSLFHPPGERRFRGKTAEREDRVHVRFVALEPPRRIVQTARFDSDDPAFHGEMTITMTFEPADGGTEVTALHENLPAGLRPEDDETGSRMSLEQLARRFA